MNDFNVSIQIFFLKCSIHTLLAFEALFLTVNTFNVSFNISFPKCNIYTLITFEFIFLIVNTFNATIQNSFLGCINVLEIFLNGTLGAVNPPFSGSSRPKKGGPHIQMGVPMLGRNRNSCLKTINVNRWTYLQWSHLKLFSWLWTPGICRFRLSMWDATYWYYSHLKVCSWSSAALILWDKCLETEVL